MPLNSHRRYQKAVQYWSKSWAWVPVWTHSRTDATRISKQAGRATPMDSRSLQRSTKPFAYHSLCMFLQVTAINKHYFLAEACFSKRPNIKPFFWPLLKTTEILRWDRQTLYCWQGYGILWEFVTKTNKLSQRLNKLNRTSLRSMGKEKNMKFLRSLILKSADIAAQ